MLKYRIFRSAAVIIPLIPIRISRPVVSFASFFVWAFARTTGQQVQRNLRHVPTLANDPARLYWATRGVFQHAALNYLDFFRGPSLSDTEMKAGWTIVNQAVYDAAMAQGRGVILISGHFGNFEFAASRLGALGYKVTAPVERMQPERLFQLFCKLRQHHNVRILAADSRDSVREMFDTLKRGEVVTFLVDRYILGASAEIPFFGEPAKMPTGAMSLALKSGAPVLLAYSWREGPGRSCGGFIPLDIGSEWGSSADERDGTGEAYRASGGARPSPASTPTATRARSSDLAAHAQYRFLHAMEPVIEQHPEQWVATLSPIWDTH
ncbi:MAG: lysophospholipid acyltransferase family protein [Ktedonobacterales bacterium]